MQEESGSKRNVCDDGSRDRLNALWEWSEGPQAEEYRWPLEAENTQEKAFSSEPSEATAATATLTLVWETMLNSCPPEMSVKTFVLF